MQARVCVRAVTPATPGKWPPLNLAAAHSADHMCCVAILGSLKPALCGGWLQQALALLHETLFRPPSSCQRGPFCTVL